MTVDAQTHVAANRKPASSGFLPALVFYLSAGAIHVALIFVSEWPVIQAPFAWLGWELAPWRAYPMPFELSEFVSQSIGLNNAAPIFLVVSTTMGFVVAALHGLTFGIVVASYAWFGWPRYWREVRSRFRIEPIWAASVRRSWWMWPAGMLLWLMLDNVAWGMSCASYPLIGDGPAYAAANVFAVCLLFAVVAARQLRAAVVQVLGPDDLRCSRCGYLLRGLELPRCPECGHEGNPDHKAEYRLRWQTPGPLRALRRFGMIGFIVALFLAPIWLPVGILQLPRRWMRYVPTPLQLDGGFFTRI